MYEYNPRKAFKKQTNTPVNFYLPDANFEGIRTVYVEYLEEQNKLMLEALEKIDSFTQISDDRFVNYSDTIHIMIKNIFEQITQKKIEDLND